MLSEMVERLSEGARVVLRGNVEKVTRVVRDLRGERVEVVYFYGWPVPWTARELATAEANDMLDRAPADPAEWRRAELEQRRRRALRARAA